MTRMLPFFCLTAISTMGTAQTMFGGRLGANYSIYGSKEGDDVPSGTTVETESVSGIGFHGGLCFQYNFDRHIGIRSELLFSMRNTRKDLAKEYDYKPDTVVLGTIVEEGEQKMSLSYIEVPVMLAIDLGDHIALHVGPGFGFSMGSKLTQEFSQDTLGVPGAEDFLYTDDFELSGEDAKKALDQRTVEIAAVIGAVYELESGLNFGLRYWRGLSSLQEDNGIINTHANVLQLSIGFNFSDQRR